MKHILCVLALATTFAFADSPVGFQTGDTAATILKRQTGQRVELRLKSGDKIGGKVEAVGEKAVHLSAVAGQELFDAVVQIDEIGAVLIRTASK